MICECIANVIRFYFLLDIRFKILKENSDEMQCNNGSVVLAFEFSNLLPLIWGRLCSSLEGEQHDELQSDYLFMI